MNNNNNTTTTNKPINIFSNDGSFLTRFKKDKTIDIAKLDKQKLDIASNTANTLSDRFKNRGKRSSPSPSTTTTTKTTTTTTLSPSSSSSSSSRPSDSRNGKRFKSNNNNNDGENDKNNTISEYQKQVASLSLAKGLREQGGGMNPMLK